MTTQGKIKVLIAKVGLDGHDRGARVVARALQEAGMEVAYTGIRQTPLMVVERAIAEGADVVGLSSLSGAHLELFPQVIEGLHERGLENVVILAGGIIPQEDGERLKALGVRAVFGPGSSLQRIVEAVQQAVQARQRP
ncbi:MAG: cobalamin B12-binding domain-containing protein [Chloroflexi bacterium]|nr:cobalamin B12-binding domain-containing protein [Chloroflexota bacterium]